MESYGIYVIFQGVSLSRGIYLKKPREYGIRELKQREVKGSD